VSLRRLAVAFVLAALLVAAPAALADADPASDVLYTQRLYLPFFGTKVSPAHAQAVKQAVDAAWKKGKPLKVALIPDKLDLGGVFQLFGKPQTYASFLAREEVCCFRGLFVTVMPQGIGVFHVGHSVVKEKAIVQKIAVPQTGADGVADAATIAVGKLAGVQVSVPKESSSSSSESGGGGTPSWMLALIAAGGAALLAAMILFGPKAYRRSQA
jgi:hypothetical protein